MGKMLTNIDAIKSEWKQWGWRIKDAMTEWWEECKEEGNLLRKVGHKGVANFLTEFYRALGVPVPRTAMYLTIGYGILHLLEFLLR